MESILIRALEMFDLLTCDFRGGDYADSCARVLMECRSKPSPVCLCLIPDVPRSIWSYSVVVAVWSGFGSLIPFPTAL
jgi:hypothetical protein